MSTPNRPATLAEVKAGDEVVIDTSRYARLLTHLKFERMRPAFTQAGVTALRTACDQAEAALRALGEWVDGEH